MKLRWLALAFLLSACSDPAAPGADKQEPDPCPGEFACLSPGVDIEVVSSAVVSSESDPQTNLPIIRPDSLKVIFKLRNRGTDTATVGDVLLNLVVPPRSTFHWGYSKHPKLAPGEEFSDTVAFTVAAVNHPSVLDDRIHLDVTVFTDQDTLRANNTLRSGLFHLAIPILRLSFEGTKITRAGDEFPVRVTLRNYGKHATAPAQTYSTCFYYRFSGCTPDSRTTAGSVSLPAVAPGATVITDVVVRIPPSSVWQDAAAHYSMYLCTPVVTGGVGYYENNVASDCHMDFMGAVRVLPDYERSCSPVVLVPDNPTMLANYNCGLRPLLPGREEDTRRYRFHLAAIDAQASVTYTIERAGSDAIIRLYDADGEFVQDLDAAPERISIGESRKVYLVMYSLHPTLAITATVEEN